MSVENKIEKWNNKIRGAIRDKSIRMLSRYHTSYRNEEGKVKYENLTFTSVLESVVNSSFSIPSLRVEVQSFGESGEVLGLYQNAYRNKLMLERFLSDGSFRVEIAKCIVDSKISNWGLMEIVKDEKSRLGSVLKRRSPFDLVTDPHGTCHDLSDSRWIALQWVRHKDALKRDSSLKNNSDLSGNYNPKLNNPEYIKRKLTEPIGVNKGNVFEDLVVGWDVYDRDEGEKLIIVNGSSLELFRGDWKGVGESSIFPIITLWYYFNPDRQLPISPTSNTIIIEDEVNDLKHYQLNHARKISRTIWVSKKGIFSNQTKRLIEGSSRDTMAEVKSGNPSDAMMAVKEKTVGFEFTQAIQTAKSGLSSLGQGFVDSRNFVTASEPNIIASNAQKVSAYESRLVEEFVSRTLTAFLGVVQRGSKSFVIPLSRDDYVGVLGERSSVLEQEFLTEEDARIFTGGSISLESVAIKLPGGKFQVEGGKVKIGLPFVSIDRKKMKGDFIVFVDRGSMKLEDMGLSMGLYDKFKEDRLIHQGDLRRIVLGAFENSKISALLRSEQDVREEMKEERESAVQGSLIEPKMKAEKDLQKTQMKTQSAEKIAEGKIISKLLEGVGEERRGEG